MTVRVKNAILAPVRVYLGTLGCKLNESEMESWTRRFAAQGAEIVDAPEDAELCVLNTCTVTHVAARKSRQMARQLARANPNARIVLTGCLVDVAPQQAGALPNVALLVANADKDRLVELAQDLWGDPRFATTETGCRMPEAASGALATEDWAPLSPSRTIGGQATTPGGPRTRAFVKIQDGCNMGCSYCIIPLARGRERSRSREQVVAEVQALVAAGYNEIVLTGVQISEYRGDAEGTRGAARAAGLRDLVAAVLSETAVPRLRLTSIAPWDLDKSLLELWSDPRLCRHLHLSLQSGSDTVLRRMRRPYTTAQFAGAVDLAREAIPDVGITTDVIVGFPGESDVEFEHSLAFVERMQFSRAHIFPYSARDGTAAASLPLHVSDSTKDARAKAMQAVANADARRFASRLVGKTLPVLWESREAKTEDARPTRDVRDTGASGRWSGYSDNYVRVTTESDADLHNTVTHVKVSSVDQDGVLTANALTRTRFCLTSA